MYIHNFIFLYVDDVFCYCFSITEISKKCDQDSSWNHRMFMHLNYSSIRKKIMANQFHKITISKTLMYSYYSLPYLRSFNQILSSIIVSYTFIYKRGILLVIRIHVIIKYFTWKLWKVFLVREEYGKMF